MTGRNRSDQLIMTGVDFAELGAGEPLSLDLRFCAEITDKLCACKRFIQKRERYPALDALKQIKEKLAKNQYKSVEQWEAAVKNAFDRETAKGKCQKFLKRVSDWIDAELKGRTTVLKSVVKIGPEARALAAMRGKDFCFDVQGARYSCSKEQAAFISDKVINMLTADRTKSVCVVRTADPLMCFDFVMRLANGGALDLVEVGGNLKTLYEIATEIGAGLIISGIFDFVLSQVGVSAHNCLERIKIKKEKNISIQEEVQFIAMNLDDVMSVHEPTHVFRRIGLEEATEVLSHPLRFVKDEDSLVEWLLGCDKKFKKLFRLVHFKRVSGATMTRFLGAFRMSDLDPAIWANLMKRCTVGGMASSGPVTIDLKEGPLNGVIAYLTKRHGGNVHERGVVNVTASSCTVRPTDPKYKLDKVENLVDFTDLEGAFYSDDCPNSYFEYDFKDQRLSVTGYTVRPAPRHPHASPLSWKLIGKTSKDDPGRILDVHRNDKSLVSSTGHQPVHIKLPSPCTPFQIIRFQQTDRNQIGNHQLVVGKFELFGVLTTE